MITTLYWYLTRDLVRITLMALVAFTLVMTGLGIVEPLRKQGLTGLQVLSLFAFTLPVMLSLTLPIAALFATTFVYGRFSQANELVAARAGGISPARLVQPAIALGILVTIASLLLSNYVTPVMAARGDRFAKANVEQIAYQQLRTKSYVRLGKHVIHAAEVRPDQHTLLGLVAAEIGAKDTRLVVAPRASVHFDTEHGRTFATFRLTDAAAAARNRFNVVRIGDTTLESWPVPDLARERTSWYTWDELRANLADPGRSQPIQQLLARIARRSVVEHLGQGIADAINDGQTYELSDGQFEYRISADSASLDDKGVVRLQGRAGDDGGTVKVVVSRQGNPRKTVTAGQGRLETVWSTRSRSMVTTLELSDFVLVRIGEQSDPPRHSEWTVSGLLVPDHIVRRADGIDLREVYRNARAFTTNDTLLRKLQHTVGWLRGKILAEMHGRVAYSLSCCLLVAMGAALGMLFRGGQVVSSFAISMAPASLVIVLIVMGKELVTNPAVTPVVGFGAIWGGLVLMLIGNMIVYGRLVRR